MIEGSIRFPKHRVTVGRGSQVRADIHSQDLIVMGSVKSNIHCTDLLDIRSESWIQGEIVDVWLPGAEAVNWGVQRRTITVQ